MYRKVLTAQVAEVRRVQESLELMISCMMKVKTASFSRSISRYYIQLRTDEAQSMIPPPFSSPSFSSPSFSSPSFSPDLFSLQPPYSVQVLFIEFTTSTSEQDAGGGRWLGRHSWLCGERNELVPC